MIIRESLKETAGKLSKGRRHNHTNLVFTTPSGFALRRSNFNRRQWKPAWDGVDPDAPDASDRQPPIVRWMRFHDGRHSHATWLTEDDIPEVARRARLGQKGKGIARTYDHVTDVMRKDIRERLEERWIESLELLRTDE